MKSFPIHRWPITTLSNATGFHLLSAGPQVSTRISNTLTFIIMVSATTFFTLLKYTISILLFFAYLSYKISPIFPRKHSFIFFLICLKKEKGKNWNQQSSHFSAWPSLAQSSKARREKLPKGDMHGGKRKHIHQ